MTECKNHLEYLHQRLKGFVRHIVILHGGRSTKERLKIQEQLASIPPEEEPSCWRPGGTLEKDLTMPAWILYSSRYQFRGKVHSCNMPGDCTGCILAKTKFGSSISWMAIYPMDIVLWGTKKVMPGLVWHREGDANPSIYSRLFNLL